VEAQEEKTGEWKSGEKKAAESMAEIQGENEASHLGTGPLVSHVPPGERIDVGVTIAVSPHAVTTVIATAPNPPHQGETKVGGIVLSQPVAAGRQGGGEKAVTSDQENPGIAVMRARALAVLLLDALEDGGMTTVTNVESIAVAVAQRPCFTE